MILTTLIVTLIVMSPTILFFLAFVIEGYMYKCPKINLSDKEDLKILKKEEKIINYKSKRIDKRCIERENVFLEDIEFIFYGYYKNKKLKKFALIPIYKQKKKHMKKILNKFVSKNPEFIYKIGNVSSTQFVEVKMLKKKGN